MLPCITNTCIEMSNRYLSRVTEITGIVATFVLAVSLTGCTLFGLGAAAGTVVGGCALLDENEDERVTQAELSTGLYDAWDTNADGELTEAEFEAGAAQRDRYAGWSGEFDGRHAIPTVVTRTRRSCCCRRRAR